MSRIVANMKYSLIFDLFLCTKLCLFFKICATEGISGTLETLKDDGKAICTTSLSACKLSLDKGAMDSLKHGLKGDSGFPGLPGQKGDRGPIGPPGSCRCFSASSFEDDSSDDPIPFEKAVPGTRGNPFKDCIQANGTNKTGTYWINFDHPMEVFCDMEKNLTCPVLPKGKRTFKHESRPFWLSQKYETEVALEKLYDLNVDQLKSLVKGASSVIQKIKYHCKNSYVYVEGDEDKSLHLLSWNDVVIGPKPSIQTPLSYSFETDGCKHSSTEWKFTEITVVADNTRVQNLPIVDFNIRDIRSNDQEFAVELTELCFGV